MRRREFLSGVLAAAWLTPASGQVQTLAPPARRRPTPGPVAIEAGWALVADERDELTLLRDATVVVRDGRVEEVRRERVRGAITRVDATRMLVLPGFISGHTHAAAGTATRGLIEGGRSYQRSLEIMDTLSDAELDDLTALNLAELLRSGCTTQVEMSLSARQAESWVRVAARWGVRGYPAPMIPGTPRLFPIWYRRDDRVLTESVAGTLDEIRAARQFALKHNGAGDGLIRPQLAPHATDTHTPETLKAILAAAREVGNGIHLHLAQGAREVTTVQRLWGMTPVRWLDRLGLLDVPVFGAHMTAVDWAADGPLLKEKGVVFAHCPSAGGAGGDSMPYPEALGAGVAVSLGIDTHSNDYLENLKLAVLYGQAREALLREKSLVPLRKPTVLDAVRSATLIPALGLKRPDLGRMRAGAAADLSAIDVSGLLVGSGALPPEPLNNLLYASGLSVQHVMTAGVWQVFDGHVIVADEQQVRRRGGVVARKIWTQLESEGWFKA